MAPVLVISGCSGVGKSTVSKLLVASLSGSVHVPIDTICRFFDDPFPDPESPEGARRYEVVGATGAVMAAQFARGGYTVILDGFVFPDGLNGMVEICGRRGVDVHYTVLRADLDTCLDRSNRRDCAGPPDLDEFRSLYARFTDVGDREGHVVDASGPPVDVADGILSAFRSGRLAVAGH